MKNSGKVWLTLMLILKLRRARGRDARRAFICAVFCLFFLSVAARAQGDDERRFLDAGRVPAVGKSFADFVPRGWVLEEKVEGDLDGDRVPDAALRLIEDLPQESKDGTWNNRHRALVVVFKRAGSFERAAVATRLLYCSLCGGALSDPAGGNLALEIKNGVLNVSQLSGAREATDLTQRFRYDARTKRFALIGEDVENYDRAVGDSTKTSTNYLTGVSVTEKRRVLKEGQEPKLVSTTRKKVAARRTFIEDIDYEKP